MLNSRKTEPIGIGGWLIVPAIMLVISPLYSLYILFMSFKMLGFLDQSIVSDIRFSLIYIIDVATILLTINGAYLFFSKKPNTRRFLINLGIFWILTQGIQSLLVATLFDSHDFDSYKGFVRSIVAGAIWIPYFIKSKRVKNTFDSNFKSINLEDEDSNKPKSNEQGVESQKEDVSETQNSSSLKPILDPNEEVKEESKDSKAMPMIKQLIWVGTIGLFIVMGSIKPDEFDVFTECYDEYLNQLDTLELRYTVAPGAERKELIYNISGFTKEEIVDELINKIDIKNQIIFSQIIMDIDNSETKTIGIVIMGSVFIFDRIELFNKELDLIKPENRAQNSDELQGNLYQHGDLGFTIEFPLKWEVKPSVYSGDIVVKARIKGNDLIATVMIYYWVLSDEEKENYNLTSSEEIYNTSYGIEYGKASKLNSSGEEKIRDLNSKWIDFRFTDVDGLERRCVGYYFLRQNEMFWILGLSIGNDEEWHNNTKIEILKSIRTFKLIEIQRPAD